MFELNFADFLSYFTLLLKQGRFDDNFKVSCPAGVGKYLICMHCFETNTCAFFFFFFFFFFLIRCRISLMRGVTCARAVRRHFRSIMQLDSSVGRVSAPGNGRSRVRSRAATYQSRKYGSSCSSLGNQTYGVELGLVDSVSG